MWTANPSIISLLIKQQYDRGKSWTFCVNPSQPLKSNAVPLSFRTPKRPAGSRSRPTTSCPAPPGAATPAGEIPFPSVCSYVPPRLPPWTSPRRIAPSRGLGARLWTRRRKVVDETRRTRCDLPHPTAQGLYAVFPSSRKKQFRHILFLFPHKHMSLPPEPLSLSDSC
jgi:hypothetical protein